MELGAKPPYRIPTVEEIRGLPKNGLRVISTFAGCGGSSTGYKLAGYDVLAAVDIVDEAMSAYVANWPDVKPFVRDVRTVTGEELLEATGLARGELDVLDGSPPCTGFSSIRATGTKGTRTRIWGKNKKTATTGDVVQRVDDLFPEFARLVDELQPRAFVAENVMGIVRGKAKGFFLEALRSFREIGYRTKAFELRGEWLGLPQARHRVFFVGLRGDLGLEPVPPKPLSYQYSVEEAFESLPADSPVEAEAWLVGKVKTYYESAPIGGSSPHYQLLYRVDPKRPSRTVIAMDGKNGMSGNCHPYEPRRFSIAETRRLCGFPDDYVLTGGYLDQFARLGLSVPPPMTAAVGRALADVLSSD